MWLANSDIENLKKNRDIEGLVKLLTYEDLSVREAAVLALGEVGDISCAVPLTERFQDPCLDIRVAACNALIKMGSQVVEIIIDVLKDENWIVREGAVQALDKLRDPRAIQPLIEALKTTNRRRISDALRSIGPASFEPLIEALKNEDSRIRMGAAMILGDMKKSDAIEPLTRATKDKDPLVKQAARTAIHMINHENRRKKNVPRKTKREST